MLAEVYCQNNEEKAFLVKTEGENNCLMRFSTRKSADTTSDSARRDRPGKAQLSSEG